MHCAEYLPIAFNYIRVHKVFVGAVETAHERPK
jgi:hypothetical protein